VDTRHVILSHPDRLFPVSDAEGRRKPPLEVICRTAPPTRPVFPRPSLTFAVNVLCRCLTLLALLLMANYLAAGIKTFNLSPDARHKLSPLTVQMLKSLTNRVKGTVFFDPENSPLQLVKGLIDRISFSLSATGRGVCRLCRWPDRGGAGKANTNFIRVGQGPGDLRSGGRPPRMSMTRIVDMTSPACFTGREARRTGFKGEQAFTSATSASRRESSSRLTFCRPRRTQPGSEDDPSVT